MKRLSILFFMLFLICSCSTMDKISENNITDKKNVLDGRKFKLVSIYPDMNITIEFNDNKISGFSAINRYSSLYEIDGDIFNVYNLITTLMSGPKDKMKAEYEYLNLLKDVTSYKIEGKKLTLYTVLSSNYLIFEEI
ncbi:heat shock protein HslJ [Brachyspira pilosicoli WesB]|uniref:Heat shock protein HslJ n=2 Tax=Brachyspira pilosicoli TaxID=52584 RepID=K0JFZ1_BRAPL|nr:META domain-containing protein [Brachyspira pilosicoli]AFR70637.1 heat shock protein [Brachyspira pilosicoli B2904]MBW5377891.1 META domain-containing protein [Brachyspira pilosicoli]WIH81817.1 META domain-containing protein [Brachyspira pilosicoli]CCG56913.1 heat shock protein HslJ [Brachyspira pilosicoli WesB]